MSNPISWHPSIHPHIHPYIRWCILLWQIHVLPNLPIVDDLKFWVALRMSHIACRCLFCWASKSFSSSRVFRKISEASACVTSARSKSTFRSNPVIWTTPVIGFFSCMFLKSRKPLPSWWWQNDRFSHIYILISRFNYLSVLMSSTELRMFPFRQIML